MKLPQYFGRLTNNLVYRRIAPGLLKKLKERRLELGRPNEKLHSGLSLDIGIPEVLLHLGTVVGLMKLHTTYEKFEKQLNTDRAYLSRDARAFRRSQRLGATVMPRARRYRLYVDESGGHTFKDLDNPRLRYLGLTGIAIQVDYYSQQFQPGLEASRNCIFLSISAKTPMNLSFSTRQRHTLRRPRLFGHYATILGARFG